jgi:hypothetical protein
MLRPPRAPELIGRGSHARAEITFRAWRPLDYLAYIRSESARFGVCLAAADPTARVPSCPDWNAADLLWHLTEVQLFWGTIVRDRLTDPDAAEAARPDRPDDFVALLALFERATAELIDALTTTPGAIEASDTRASWRVAFGRFVGTGPDSGKLYDMDAIRVVAAAEHDASFTARGNAADLDAWLWGRAPVERLEVDGDRDAFARLEQIVARGVD